ncbi:LysE/ArgO family amino acid transporter [Georgenia sp. EYE_87]|uniref:LysE/ArgO family amino acid transporter n=1 Tax=Georgenia sp. EYE_87 TaxID=2853448 RepID=UPI0020044F7E|nr:LysE/ArgO family amino acid transporter [Georgenia sp. EYE_87]MCK6211268.1 LysE/ArgO family amino acid transporter [Georgenia sp. EYE_87]
MSSAVSGLLTGLSLIVAIGAQNAFVLRQGLARRYLGVVVAICAVSDALLILAGVSGIGAVVRDHPTALTALRWVGAAYLMGYGVLSLLRLRRPQALDAAEARAGSLRSAVVTTLALTYLNPHVYLDTVLMLGSIANQHGDPGRWWFAAGAAAGSIVWFTALGYGARAASPVLARPVTWRILDLLIGVVMIALAVRLILG